MPPHPAVLDHHRVNPPLLEPGTYAVDEAEYGHDCVVGSIVASPGDVRGTEFVHERVDIGCWSVVSRRPFLACIACGALVAGRTDDCCVPQETRFHSDMVVWEACGEDPPEMPSVFPLIAGVGTMRFSEAGLSASAEDDYSLANLEAIVTTAHVPLRFVVLDPDVARYLRTFAAADLSLRLKVVQISGL